MIKIGYQGMEGSNSYAAAQAIAKNLNLTDIDFCPLITSKGVADALMNGTIQYGVVAIHNNLAGTVIETKKVLDLMNYEILGTHTLTIEHHLFVKSSTIAEIQTVASHIQALKQCQSTLENFYPNVTWKELEDTAIGAKYLSEGVLSNHTGVLCRKDAGIQHGLHLLQEHLQDTKENYTDFICIRLLENCI